VHPTLLLTMPLNIGSKPNHHIRLNYPDIIWWHLFTFTWDSISMFGTRTADFVVTFDASDFWGCEALLEESMVLFPIVE